MKTKLNAQLFPYLVLGCGGLGLVLRALLYATGEDSKGLLQPWHICTILVWLLTAAVIGATALFLRDQDGSNRYRDNFPASKWGAIGAFAAGAGIAVTVLSELRTVWDTLSILWLVLGLLGAACLVLTGICRLKGKRPQFFFHGILCLFFALNLAIQYRLTSNDPQLQDYVFQIFACIALMLTAYQHTAFDAGMGSRRSLLLFSLLAVYLCCVCLYGGSHTLLYLTCGAWALLNICSLTPVPRRRRPETAAPAEDIPADGE